MTPSIGIPMKRAYSVVHYLSNKHTQTSTQPNRSQVTASFVKTVACPSKKRKEKMNENIHLFTEIILTFQNCTFHIFLFEIPSICSWTYFHSFHPFYKWWFHTPPLECVQIIWVSWITWASVLKFWPHSSYLNNGNNQKSHGVWSSLYTECFITSMI